MSRAPREAVYELLIGDDEGRICKDIPEEACDDQPGNFLKHVVSLTAAKTGDGLFDPKLVLSWLLGAVGAPTFLVGLLVPVRDAGALLPQLFIAGAIRSLPQRKWVWALGSVVQGLAVAGIGAAALGLTGAAAGWSIVGLLAVFALARSACSVSFKDVLGKTVSKSTRGTVGGTAGTAAAALVLAFGLLLSSGALERSVEVIAGALFVAAGLWLSGAAVHASLPEAAGATEGGGNAIGRAWEQLGLLRRDGQLARFVATRALLLLATALAPPYLLELAGRGGGRRLGELGLFVVASSLAAIGSTYVWGRLADVSSCRVLILSSLVAAAALAAAAVLGSLGARLVSGYPAAALLLVLMVAYRGVRLGRSTHIVDMADPELRATYTAVSNTVIGVLLVVAGLFGLVAHAAGSATVLGIFALMCLGSALTAAGLREVQAEG